MRAHTQSADCGLSDSHSHQLVGVSQASGDRQLREYPHAHRTEGINPLSYVLQIWSSTIRAKFLSSVNPLRKKLSSAIFESEPPTKKTKTQRSENLTRNCPRHHVRAISEYNREAFSIRPEVEMIPSHWGPCVYACV